jgi:hypothetical protein
MAMSVTRPALSRASVAPGTSRSTRAATSRRRCALRERVASSCTYSVRICSPSRISATAPFSGTMAATGQSRANGSLHPTGRPVMATTGTPRARSANKASSAAGSMTPPWVSVSSMSVKTPCTAAQAARGDDAKRWGRGVMASEFVTSPTCTSRLGASIIAACKQRARSVWAARAAPVDRCRGDG